MAVTIQDDMGRVAMMLPESQRVEFMGALALYGVCGVEPDPEAAEVVRLICQYKGRSMDGVTWSPITEK